MADIGQGIVEEVTTVTKGANLGWRVWEGSYRFVNGAEVSIDAPRSDPKVTYPVVEFAQLDPLLQNSSAVTLGYVYRHNRLKALANLLLVRRQPVGGDVLRPRRQAPANGGQDAIRRIVFNDKGQTKTLLELVQEKNVGAGQEALGARRPSVRRRAGRPHLHPEQMGRRDPGARALAGHRQLLEQYGLSPRARPRSSRLAPMASARRSPILLTQEGAVRRRRGPATKRAAAQIAESGRAPSPRICPRERRRSRPSHTRSIPSTAHPTF